MSLYVECKPDETLALALGVLRRDLEHALNRPGVCNQLARRRETIGMVDEDPNSPAPTYMKQFEERSWEHGIRLLHDPERHNRLVVISPRMDEWLVQTARSAGIKMTDFGFESDSGRLLHGEINRRLENVKRLGLTLLSARNPRILRLQSLIKPV